MDLLPVVYSAQKNAWMESSLFHEWFHSHFIPCIQEKLGEAVLVLDNCAAHPDANELVSENGKIIAKFLSPNVTSLIQPMDQGVLVGLKRRYKKKLLGRMVFTDEDGMSIVDFLKSVNTKVVVDLISDAWDEVKGEAVKKSWEKIIPLDIEDDIQMVEFDEHTADVSEMATMLNRVQGEDNQIGEDDVCIQQENPATGKDDVNQDDDDDDDENTVERCPISHGAAADMLDKCLKWLEFQPEANLYNLTTLHELQSLVVKKQ
ncbi:jerky protein homolog-like [Dysidea avara]|uniref:jerky protein homolog-like n=1 Tax=Dysidea avara TaxID=196820 RepID=UPI0033248279